MLAHAVVIYVSERCNCNSEASCGLWPCSEASRRPHVRVFKQFCQGRVQNGAKVTCAMLYTELCSRGLDIDPQIQTSPPNRTKR